MVTIRWTPAQRGIESNEVADQYAKWAAGSPHDRVDREYLRGASLAHLTRKTTEARTQRTREWIRNHVSGSRRHRPPLEGKISKGFQKSERVWQVATTSCLWARLDRALPGRKDQRYSVKRLLAVRRWGATAPLPPLLPL